ncbi:hypothetical protein H2201_003694 [Coniosporium apollinis]|uniref:Uncharacterized protein n=2 Tax=Coniosporium TaxID=2810619 RepID=A0ABQ9NV42_9PEZI|nr:hypothetical protein H2199_002764 [Cladosporium sp. JES 115]KAJ9666260.1 hypothetical protein H2201_003694 [Coniosporium apollinis]
MTRKMELMRRYKNHDPSVNQWMQLFGEEWILELSGTEQPEQLTIDSDSDTDGELEEDVDETQDGLSRPLDTDNKHSRPYGGEVDVVPRMTLLTTQSVYSFSMTRAEAGWNKYVAKKNAARFLVIHRAEYKLNLRTLVNAEYLTSQEDRDRIDRFGGSLLSHFQKDSRKVMAAARRYAAKPLPTPGEPLDGIERVVVPTNIEYIRAEQVKNFGAMRRAKSLYKDKLVSHMVERYRWRSVFAVASTYRSRRILRAHPQSGEERPGQAYNSNTERIHEVMDSGPAAEGALLEETFEPLDLDATEEEAEMEGSDSGCK